MTTVMPDPAEILRSILLASAEINGVAPGGVTVGGANDAAIANGTIVLTHAGPPTVEKYIPALRANVNLRAVAASEYAVNQIANTVQLLLHQRDRRVVRMESVGEDFLVHYTVVRGGPYDASGDVKNTFASFMTIEMMVGTDPVL